MDGMDLRLVDFKIEFGRSKDGQILLADEISPDTCRIWDKYSDTNFDKDVYRDRKSTRLNSSHVSISYAVFCLKKKKTKPTHHTTNKNIITQNNKYINN